MKPRVADPAMTPARERSLLLTLAAVQFTAIVDFMVVMPLGPELMSRLALGPSHFGLIVSAYTFSACASGLLAGLFVDRFDRRTTVLTLYTGFLAGNVCCALSTSYATLLAARVVTGAFGGILGGMALAIIGDVFPEQRRGAATGVLMSAFAVASVAGVPLGLYLGNRYGWHAPFWFLSALGCIVLAGAYRALPRLRGHLAHAIDQEPAPRRLWRTLTEPNHLRAFALVLTIMVGGFSIIPYISVYLVYNVGVTPAQLPLVYICGGALTLVSAPLIGRLADRFGKVRIYRIVAPAAAAVTVAMTNLPRVPLAAALATSALLMVGNSGRMVVALAMVTGCVEPSRRGSFMTANSAVQHLSSGVGAFLGGLILGQARGGALVGFGQVGVLSVLATIASLLLAGRLRSAEAGMPLDEIVSVESA
jgi:predicted MFS family arabinose efflux permease